MGVTLPVATTLFAKSALSTFASFDGSIFVPPLLAASTTPTHTSTSRITPTTQKIRFFFFLPLPFATYRLLLDVLPVKIMSLIRACGAVLVSNTLMFAALFRAVKFPEEFLRPRPGGHSIATIRSCLDPASLKRKANKDHFRMKSHRDQAGAQSTSAAPVTPQELVSQKILNRALGDSA
jgi:hypothetical protein